MKHIYLSQTSHLSKTRLLSKTALALATLTALLISGCKETPSAFELKYEIERQIPGAHLERESHVHLGRMAMSLVKKIARWADAEDEDDLQMIRHIRKVCVATYRIDALPDLEVLDTQRLEKRLARRGWDTVVKQRDDGERTWIFTRGDDEGSIDNLYIIALDQSELTVVDLAGRIDRVMADAFADDPEELMEILGP